MCRNGVDKDTAAAFHVTAGSHSGFAFEPGLEDRGGHTTVTSCTGAPVSVWSW